MHLLDTNLASSPEPVTMSLTLTRQGPSLKLDTKVVRRDEPGHVISARSITDGSGVDVAGDNGAPPSGPVWAVWVPVGTLDGSAPGEAVFDNLLCSTDPVLVTLGIQRIASSDVRLEWSSGYSILLEANGLAGPWYPWPGIASAASGGYRASIPCSEPAKFFRLVPGEQWLDEFDTMWSEHSWKFASSVLGETSVPDFTRPNGQARIRVPADRSADFVRYWSMGFGEYHRCLASVDIVDWGETMEDAAFGIVLRAKPDKDLWLPAADGLPHNRYLGLLTFKKAGSPSESVLSVTGPGGEVLKTQAFPAVDPARQYQLRFWAVGEQLTLELFDLDNLDAPMKTCEATDGRVPAGLDALYGTRSASGTYDVTIDRYQFTGEYR